jgi:tetratricopeptide (TPR) repeat protein
MIHSIRCTILVSALFFSQLIYASAEYKLQTLQTLFNNYQRQAAYDYASRYVRQMEGNVYFDYFYGVSAIDSGHASQGVFALERVILLAPADHVARLELARGYFILQEYARARKEFERVISTNPPPGVNQTTQRFLALIRLREAKYRTTSNGFVALSIGHDSNITAVLMKT